MHITTLNVALMLVCSTALDAFAVEPPSSSDSRPGQTPPPAGLVPEMVIVTPQRFEVDLRPLVEHRSREFAVQVATLETVLGDSAGVDDPEKLKRYLYRAWKERHCAYVLLVGDSSLLPVRYMVLDRVTPAAFDYAFYPSDLYYADVARQDGSFDDWNSQKDGFHALYFGEVRGEKNKDDPINYDQAVLTGRNSPSVAGRSRQPSSCAMWLPRHWLSRSV